MADDDLLLQVVEKITALDAEYQEGKRNAKEVARETTHRLNRVATDVSGISTTVGQVLEQQRITNGRVNSHDVQIDALERERAVREAIRQARSWRFTAAVAVLVSVTSGVVVAFVSILIR